MATSPAFAADGAKMLGGGLLMAGGYGVWAWADSEADDEEAACERNNSNSNVNRALLRNAGSVADSRHRDFRWDGNRSCV